MKSFFISNLLSLLRCPLALLFLSPDPFCRVLSLSLALLTDFLDGFIARTFSATSQLGAFLDPLMDRFYVVFVGMVLLHEQQLPFIGLAFLLSRDVLLIIVGFYLAFKKGRSQFFFKATLFGKITTVAQFVLLFILTYWQLSLPIALYSFFVIMGILTSWEVLNRKEIS